MITALKNADNVPTAYQAAKAAAMKMDVTETINYKKIRRIWKLQESMNLPQHSAVYLTPYGVDQIFRTCAKQSMIQEGVWDSVKGAAKSGYNAVKGAMRRAIHHQLKEYRDSVNLPTICCISGLKSRLGMKTDIDHVGVTFSEIADSFMQMKVLKYTDISLVGPPTAKKFKDDILWKEWVAYHLAKARFAMTLASANRSKGSDGYITPVEIYGSFAKEDPEDLALDF
jgi:hypothetical protein